MKVAIYSRHITTFGFLLFVQIFQITLGFKYAHHYWCLAFDLICLNTRLGDSGEKGGCFFTWSEITLLRVRVKIKSITCTV